MYNNIPEFPRGDSKPKKRLQENRAIPCLVLSSMCVIDLFSRSLLLGLESSGEYRDDNNNNSNNNDNSNNNYYYVYIYIYVHVFVCICVYSVSYIYIYTYIYIYIHILIIIIIIMHLILEGPKT